MSGEKYPHNQYRSVAAHSPKIMPDTNIQLPVMNPDRLVPNTMPNNVIKIIMLTPHASCAASEHPETCQIT